MPGGISLNVEGDVKAVLRSMSDVQKKIVPAVAASSLNTTAGELVKMAIKQAARAARIPQKYIKYRYASDGTTKKARRIYVRKSGKAKARKLWTHIYTHPRDISWTSMGAKDSTRVQSGKRGRAGSGVSAPGGRRDRKAFIAASSRGGARLAWVRVPDVSGGQLVVKKAKVAGIIRAATDNVITRMGSAKFNAIFSAKLDAAFRRRGLS